ncbi:WbuC family cupin fold metalloprotein [Phormidium nigroviride]
MRTKEFNKEVLYADEPIVKVNQQDIESLKEMSQHNIRQRIRLCSHKGVDDKLHEMLIVHAKDTYVRPHKHLNKSESFHIIEGSTEVIIFNEEGSIVEAIQMGDFKSGKQFYYRLSEPYYHTLLIHSEFLVFHETTSGPFNRSDTVFALWSPSEEDTNAVSTFMESLTKQLHTVSYLH